MNNIELREVPFTVNIEVTGVVHQLEAVQVLRRLPGRRLVVRGQIEGRDVAAKFFLGAKAERDYGREKAGVLAAANAGALTPGFVIEGLIGDGFCLAFEWVADASQIRSADAAEVIELNARLHKGGVIQKDLHIDNFVASRQGIYLVDGGRITMKVMGRRASLTNLAGLLAELDSDAEGIDAGYRIYCAARGWTVAQNEGDWLRKVTSRRQGIRVRRFLKKTLRRCSQFEVERHGGHEVIYDRDEVSHELTALLDAPASFVDNGVALKVGNTALVVRVAIGKKRYVVKRYNAKQRRARKSWVNGHRLRFRGIATAKPIALIEPRGLGPTFLVLDDLGDVDLVSYVKACGVDDVVLKGVMELFDALERNRLTHRDTKATNFMVTKGSVFLVDLDALRPALSSRGGSRDRQRFLRNWDTTTAELFAARFGMKV
jgi:tRNA A-37 threonylcarbamoyl transferase component Bud32